MRYPLLEVSEPKAGADRADVVLREYETLLDVARNEATIFRDDFYGRPAPAGKVGSRAWLEAVHPEDAGALGEALSRTSLLARGEVYRCSLRFRHDAGGYVRAEYENRPLVFGEGGRVRLARSRVRWVSIEPDSPGA